MKYIKLFLFFIIGSTMLFGQNNTNLNSKMIETNNGAFPIIDEGSGIPVLLLHGFPDSKELWTSQIQALSEQGFRVIAPDLRGYGNAPSPIEKEQYAMSILMSDVIGIMNALQLEKVHLVGHDFGASLAWSLTKYYEHRFNTLTVLSVGIPGNPGWATIEQKQKSWYFYFFLQEGLAEKELADYNWKLAKEAFMSHPNLEDVLIRIKKPNALTTALNWYRGNLQHLISQPNVDYLPATKQPEVLDAKIKIPTMGIWSGKDDFLTENQMTQSSVYVEKFRYRKIEDGSHWMMLDKPAEVNRLLIEFFNQQK